MSVRIFSSLAVVITVTAAVVPISAFAAGAYHPMTSEIGATYHPDHASVATRDQIIAELDQAKKHPAWNSALSRGAPWPAERSGEPKTRAQVNAELQTAMKDPAWNSVSRGAPWPPAPAIAK